MAVSSSFKLAVALVLTGTVLSKALFTSGIRNPREDDVVKAADVFLRKNGYDVAGKVEFAGRLALLAQRNACLMYVVPVAHQGWHQATVRQALNSSQRLSFAFEGKVTRDTQETYYPLFVYYLHKAVSYFGVEASYPPVLALVTSDTCDLNALKWADFPSIPFQATALDPYW